MAKQGGAVVPLRDRLWARVVGGALVTIATGIALDKLKVLPVGDWIAVVAKALWHLLTSRYEIQHWLVWIIGVGCAALVGQVVRREMHRRSVRRYREDFLLDLVWKWRYGDDKKTNAIVSGSITPYCPECQLRMNFGTWEAVQGGAVLPITCPGCHRIEHYLGDSAAVVRERIAGLVEKEITNGAWKSKRKKPTTPVTIWY